MLRLFCGVDSRLVQAELTSYLGGLDVRFHGDGTPESDWRKGTLTVSDGVAVYGSPLQQWQETAKLVDLATRWNVVVSTVSPFVLTAVLTAIARGGINHAMVEIVWVDEMGTVQVQVDQYGQAENLPTGLDDQVLFIEGEYLRASGKRTV